MLCKKDTSNHIIKGNVVYGGNENQKFYKCDNCDVVYLYPKLNKIIEKKFYKKEFEKFMSKRAGQDMNWDGPEQHVKSSEREAKRRMNFLQPFLKKKLKILEVGCSSGFMLYKLKNEKQTVSGIDPSGTFISYIEANNIKCFKNINQVKKSGIK